MTAPDDRFALPPPTRVLVVEVDLAGRELLARVLRARGCEALTTVGVAKAALVLAEDIGPFDLLVLDMNGGTEEGVDLLRLVAALPAHQRPRRIAVLSQQPGPTAAAIAGIALPIEQFGKPVHLPSLMRLVDALREFKV